MANIYGPILPLQLDPRNTSALVRDMQTKVFLESGGQLNDFSPASPLTPSSSPLPQNPKQLSALDSKLSKFPAPPALQHA